MLSRYLTADQLLGGFEAQRGVSEPPPVGDIQGADDPRRPEQAQHIEAFYRELGQRGEVEGELNGQTVNAYEAARASELIQWAEFCAGRDAQKARVREETIAREGFSSRS